MPANHVSCPLPRQRRMWELSRPSSGRDRATTSSVSSCIHLNATPVAKSLRLDKGIVYAFARARFDWVVVYEVLCSVGGEGGEDKANASNTKCVRVRDRNKLHVPPWRTSRTFSRVDSHSCGYDMSDRLCRRPPKFLNAVSRPWLSSGPPLVGEGCL